MPVKVAYSSEGSMDLAELDDTPERRRFGKQHAQPDATWVFTPQAGETYEQAMHRMQYELRSRMDAEWAQRERVARTQARQERENELLSQYRREIQHLICTHILSILIGLFALRRLSGSTQRLVVGK